MSSRVYFSLVDTSFGLNWSLKSPWALLCLDIEYYYLFRSGLRYCNIVSLCCCTDIWNDLATLYSRRTPSSRMAPRRFRVEDICSIQNPFTNSFLQVGIAKNLIPRKNVFVFQNATFIIPSEGHLIYPARIPPSRLTSSTRIRRFASTVLPERGIRVPE